MKAKSDKKWSKGENCILGGLVINVLGFRQNVKVKDGETVGTFIASVGSLT